MCILFYKKKPHECACAQSWGKEKMLLHLLVDRFQLDDVTIQLETQAILIAQIFDGEVESVGGDVAHL